MLWMSYLLHPHFTSLLVAAKTVRQHMSLRKCGERIVPKANHRLDAYTTREDMNVLDEYGIGIEPIAEMRGAVKAREFNGQEYWSLAYTKRKECHDIVFFVENRDDGTNQEASRITAELIHIIPQMVNALRAILEGAVA